MRRNRRLAALSATLLVLLAACAENAPQDTLKAQGPIARQINDLMNPVFIVAGLVFVLVQGLVLFAVIKFRARPDSPEPQQIHGNTRLEVGWTLAPALILLAVAVPTIATIFDLAREPENPVHVTVIGHQFWWEYRYPDLGVVTANELRMPVGRPVELTLNSDDVIHSYWIPALAGKQDVVPGRNNRMQLIAEEPGHYLGQCAEFCGDSHANMRAKAIAMTPQDFDAWVASQRAPSVKASPGTAGEAGALLFSQKGCGGCHTVEGVSEGTIGPDLTHFASRTTFAGSIYDTNDANLRRWLRDPQGEKPGNAMIIPGAPLTPDEITELIVYLNTLR
ncbi:MAG TPA: cytochrome c oxidase subunit II [Acidimicrobiales bacterium]|nr:cytochrome c oxidase subunit II [Acidimicrobiales bacterium]